MPTGGVSPERKNLEAWFNAGVTCVGMGSQLISSDILKNRSFDLLQSKVEESLDLIKEIKNA
jgi:2-dehydro-3-deoxyphosphogluconate aldolase/(4S)-4-hydroxy-2-oxoglutarate aldolase